jgi:peptidoglycan hydrolase CwlO-like protein
MKRIITVLISMVVCLAVSAQVPDTLLVKQVKSLEKQAKKLQNSNWSLQKKVKQLEENTDLIKKEMEQGRASFEKAGQELEAVKTSLSQHQTDSDTRFASLEKWSKSTMLWLIIILGVLAIALLVLYLVSRSKMNTGMTKLEAKVDNMRDALELEIKEVKKTHDTDLEGIKKAVDELKKK